MKKAANYYVKAVEKLLKEAYEAATNLLYSY